MFHMIKTSRFLQINAENSLTNVDNKFINRFVDVFALVIGKSRCYANFAPLNKSNLVGGAIIARLLKIKKYFRGGYP